MKSFRFRLVLDKQMFQALSGTALLKLLSAVSGLVVTYVITHSLDTEGVGVYFYGISLITVFSVILRLGFDNVVIKRFGAESVSPQTNGFLFAITCLVFFVAAIVSITIFFLAEYIGFVLFEGNAYYTAIKMAFSVIPLSALCWCISMAYQGVGRPALSILFQNLGFNICLIVGMFLFLSSKDLGSFLRLTQFAYAFVCLAGIALWFTNYRNRSFQIKDIRIRTQDRISAQRLWLAGSMSMICQWAGIIFAGSYIGNGEMAILQSAQRLSHLVTFF